MNPPHTAKATLRRRSLAEWRDRGRQASFAILERFGLAADARPAALRRPELEVSPGKAFADPGAALRHFRDVAPVRFLAGTRDVQSTVQSIRKSDISWTDRILASARQGSAGRPQVLGYPSLPVGDPVDWHLDPVSGRRAPVTHWSRVPFLDAAVVGDHKVTWEVNRHQWLVPLAIAWHIEGDDRLAERVFQLLDGWIERNPPKLGINWASSLEIAFRSIAWLWILYLLRDSNALTERRFTRLAAMLAIGGRHIERNLSTWFSPNTHLTGEALGLLYLGYALPELRGSQRWRELGLSILVEWMPLHVRTDGTYLEQSTHYARYTVDFLVHAIALLRRNGEAEPPALSEALARGARFLRHIVRPDGTLPLLGDDDGGRVMFLDLSPPEDVRSTLAVAGALLDDPTLVFPDAGGNEEVAWLLGPDALSVPAILSSSPPEGLSRLFADGGVATLRNGWARDSSLAVLDCGPHGFGRGGHAHADLGSFDLTIQGHPLVVDPGTWTYLLDGGGRDAFRAPSAHAVPIVDGVGTAEPDSAFSWTREPHVLSRSSCLTETFDLVAFTHDGFLSLPDPVAHRRALARLACGSWLVIDAFACKEHHELTLSFPLAGGLQSIPEGCRALVRRGDEPFARFISSATHARWDNPMSWTSRTYGHRERAERLQAHLSFDNSLLVVTLIEAASTEGQAMHVRREGEEYVITLAEAKSGGIELRCGPTSGTCIDASGRRTDWTWPALLRDATEKGDH